MCELAYLITQGPQEHRANTNHFLSGGLEMLFSDQRIHKLTIPTHDADGKAVTIAYLITHLCENVMKDNRKDLFVLDDHMYVVLASYYPFISFQSILPHTYGKASLCLHPRRGYYEKKKTITADTPSSRPGILVLINDADWELEGEEAYEIKSGDNILFVSTLHGG